MPALEVKLADYSKDLLREKNAIEIMNELTLFFASYFLFFFTSFIPDQKMKYEMGWYFVGLATFNIGVNWLAMIYKFGAPVVNAIRNKLRNCKKAKK